MKVNEAVTETKHPFIITRLLRCSMGLVASDLITTASSCGFDALADGGKL
jgi:hypothetical protein